MQGLRKDDQLNIRMQKKVKAKIRRAARIESRRRQRIVEPGPLLLELGLPGIERILTGSSPSAASEEERRWQDARLLALYAERDRRRRVRA